jgi:hypothetical protein
LPKERQEQVMQQLNADANNQEKINEVLKKKFREEQLQKAFNKAVEDAIKGWISAIDHSLSDDQRSKLIQIAQDLQPASSKT